MDVKVFQPDGVRTENSSMSLNNFNLAHDSFTVCIAFYTIYTGTYITLATYATENNENNFYISKLHHQLGENGTIWSNWLLKHIAKLMLFDKKIAKIYASIKYAIEGLLYQKVSVPWREMLHGQQCKPEIQGAVLNTLNSKNAWRKLLISHIISTLEFPKYHELKVCVEDDENSACIETHVNLVSREWIHLCITVETIGEGIKMVVHRDALKAIECKSELVILTNSNNGIEFMYVAYWSRKVSETRPICLKHRGLTIYALLHFILSVTENKFKTVNIPTDGILILGQDQDARGGDLDAEQSFSGKIGYFNAWNKKLTTAEIQAIHNCQDLSGGSIVSWTTANWIIRCLYCQMLNPSFLKEGLVLLYPHINHNFLQ